MPVYNLKIGDKEFKVEVSKTAENTFNVKINGKNREVKFKRDIKSENLYSVALDDVEYTVEVPEVSRRKPFTIKVGDVDFNVQVRLPQRKHVSLKPSTPLMPSSPRSVKTLEISEGVVTAPMTGKIVSIRVKEGETVKEGQVVCILEAMKMENEIVAPKSGKVKEVLVSEGTAVNEGEALVLIE